MVQCVNYTMRAYIQQPTAIDLRQFCRRAGVRRMMLFGSVLRADFRPESDIDVLVEFEPGRTPGFFALHDMQEALSGIFGRKVDLRTPQDLSRYFRERVLSEAEVIYERG